MARDRAAANVAFEALLADLAVAHEIDRSELEGESVVVVFTDNEHHAVRVTHGGVVEFSPENVFDTTPVEEANARIEAAGAAGSDTKDT